MAGALAVIHFITYSFPPMKYPRSPQIAHLVHGLKDLPINVFAAEIDFNLDLSLDTLLQDVSQKVCVTRVPYGRFAKWVYHLKGNRFKEWLLPDAQFLWTKDLYTTLCPAIGPKDTIVTFGQPMSLHTIGLKLKAKYKTLRWFANFSDPWCNNPFNEFKGLSRVLNNYYQQEVFNTADKLLFNSEETMNAMLATENQCIQNKGFLLPHCFRKDLYSITNTKDLNLQKDKDSRFTIRYLGHFYGPRKPLFLMEVFKAIHEKDPTFFKHHRFEFIGGYELSLKEKILLSKLPEGAVLFLDAVDYITSLQLMRSADLLLLIDAPLPNNIFFPSKLADYMGSERPIFGITPPGTSQRILNSLGFLTIAPSENIATLCDTLMSLSSRYQNIDPGNPSVRNAYSQEAVCDTLKALLNCQSHTR